MPKPLPPRPKQENLQFHKILSVEGLLKFVHTQFSKIQERQAAKAQFSRPFDRLRASLDVLMSGLAIFGLKFLVVVL